MKLVAVSLLILASAFSVNVARADSDDAKWIDKCVADNAKESVAKEVILKYCTCMNNKMDSNEAQSITQWEKSHPNERAACDKESGWK